MRYTIRYRGCGESFEGVYPSRIHRMSYTLVERCCIQGCISRIHRMRFTCVSDAALLEGRKPFTLHDVHTRVQMMG